MVRVVALNGSARMGKGNTALVLSFFLKGMEEAGASHTLMVFKGQKHGFGGEYKQKAMDAMWVFFDEHLRP